MCKGGDKEAFTDVICRSVGMLIGAWCLLKSSLADANTGVAISVWRYFLVRGSASFGIQHG